MNTKIDQKLKSIVGLLAIFTVLISVSFNALMAKTIESNRLETAVELADEMAFEYGRDQVLVVFDIDNTLLAMNQDIGSDQWFSWQSKLIKSGDFSMTVADSFAGLLAAQQKLYALSSTHPTQENAAGLIKSLQNNGISVMALTARSVDYRDSTMRELKNNNIIFDSDSTLPSQPEPYMPYDLGNIANSGISPNEVQDWNLGEPRQVSMVNGVMMVAGQHKGAMLRSLLAKTNKKYKSIIFVDDKVKNTNSVEQGFSRLGEEIWTIRYSREDEQVEAFARTDKNIIHGKWLQLNAVLESTFK